MQRLLSVNIGQPRPIAGKSGQTGHFKQRQDGVAAIGTLGLVGDAIVDTKNHGGVDQAVYLFDTADFAWWSDVLGRELLPGFFGENLTVEGLATGDIALGDRFCIGDVVLEVTSPRIPCVTLANILSDPGFPKRFIASERCGYYARVLTEGAVAAGMDIRWLRFERPRCPVTDLLPGKPRGEADRALLLRTPLHYKARAEFEAAGT